MTTTAEYVPTPGQIARARRNAAIVRGAKEGMTDDALARKYGVSVERVRQIRHAAGVPKGKRRRVGRPAKADRNAQIAADYEAGMTMEEVGEKFGITRERVRQILESRGVPSRPKNYSKTEPLSVELAKKGKTVHEIAAATGRKPGTVYEHLKKAGVRAKRGNRIGTHRRLDCAKLNDAAVVEIWDSDGDLQALAKKYRVTIHTVRMVRTARRYAERVGQYRLGLTRA